MICSSFEVDVYGKKTRTIKYVDFTFNNPLQHQKAVMRMLLNRAHLLLSHSNLRTGEEIPVTKDQTDVQTGYYENVMQRLASYACRHSLGLSHHLSEA